MCTRANMEPRARSEGLAPPPLASPASHRREAPPRAGPGPSTRVLKALARATVGLPLAVALRAAATPMLCPVPAHFQAIPGLPC